MTRTKVISYSIILAFIYIFVITSLELPVAGSLWFRRPRPHTSDAGISDTDTSDIIDANMTFTMFPKEVSVMVNDTFAIQVGVENVTDMYAWQVYLHFNPEMLECVNVYLPFDHVFSYGIMVGGALVGYNATMFTSPLQRVWNDEGRVLTGDCLLGANQSTFNGSGALCQIEFRMISTGSSFVRLRLYSNKFGSYILDSKLRGIKPLSTVDCTIIRSES
ncbi:MAG: cohesin domain-containing protein [Candidatus Bathyarchaeota archaeon]|nr:cohesin domain-containing protein [Candidatus Bathyarchaeota archaeon]